MFTILKSYRHVQIYMLHISFYAYMDLALLILFLVEVFFYTHIFLFLFTNVHCIVITFGTTKSLSNSSTNRLSLGN